jgi:hypothetical protein
MACGLASPKRGHRLLVILRAFIDDSGNEPTGPVFLLAGFISTAERWERFSDEWAAVCAQPPATPNFHMVQAERLKGGYWGIGADDELAARRDRRVGDLVEVIMKHAMIRINAAMDWNNYNRMIKGKVPPQTDNPYFWCFANLIMEIARSQSRVGMREKVSFVFDHDLRAIKYVNGWHVEMLGGDPGGCSICPIGDANL